MAWFRWKAKQDPWGDNFSIVLVTLPDTGPGEPKIYTVPFDQHLQLIGCALQLNPGLLPGGMWAYVWARRGGQMLHYSPSQLQGTVIGVSRGWLGVNLVRWQDRNALPRASAPLSDYFYLYPHDDVLIQVEAGGATGFTIQDCSFTFKQWLTS